MDLKLIKVALESAKFDDFRVRELIYLCIDETAKDLLDIEYEASIQTETVFEKLEEHLEEEEVEQLEEEDDEEEIEITMDEEEEDDL